MQASRVIESLEVLTYRLESLARSCFENQIKLGDFHLKTTVGVLGANAYLQSIYLNKKLQLMGCQTKAPVPRIECDSSLPKIHCISRLVEDICQRLSELHEDSLFWWDSDLYWTIQSAKEKMNFFAEAIRQWVAIGPTDEKDLQSHAGLLRDCDIREVLESNFDGNLVPRTLTDKDLFDPLLRASYLCGNAYLEISAIDIISDLILITDQQEECSSRSWIKMGLVYQLIDECQHAELLAERVEALGFELGMVAVSTHTWSCYKHFTTIAEKVIAQQVLQEGVGLDSSALNVKRFSTVNDNTTSELYQKITLDELNHVRLGVQISKALSGERQNEIYKATRERVAQIDPLPEIPQFVELKCRAGMPKEWL